jgi:hypothetical protein
MKKYFKVIPFINNEVVIDTNETNYGSTLNRADELENLLLCISNYSYLFNIPISVFFSLNNGIAMFGDFYLQQLPQSNNGIFTADQFTKDPCDKQFVIKKFDLFNFIKQPIK